MVRAELKDLVDVAVAHDTTITKEPLKLSAIRMEKDHPGCIIITRDNATSEIYPVEEHVYKQFGRILLDLPSAYLRKMVDVDPELAARNFNFWIQQNRLKEVLVKFRKNADGDKHTAAFLPSNFFDIPYTKIVEILISIFKNIAVDYAIDNNKFNLEIFTGEIDKSLISVGDEIRWGFNIVDSDVGLYPMTLDPITFTLACLNGMVIRNKTNTNLMCAHTQRNFKDTTVDDLLLGVMSRHNAFVQAHILNINNAASKEIDDVELAIDNVSDRYPISKVERKYVEAAWDKESRLPESVYRLSQAFTRAGTHGVEIKSDFESSRKLLTIGGNILMLASMKNFRFN